MGLIVPLTAGQPSDLLAAAQTVPADVVDFLEWRLDFFAPAVEEAESGANTVSRSLLATIQNLWEACLTASTAPLLFTWRTMAEGGQCPAQLSWYRDLLERLVEARVPALDIEYAALDRVYEEKLLAVARSGGSATVLSKHYFSGTPDLVDLSAELSEMADFQPSYVKLACLPLKNLDVANLMVATARTKQQKNVALITMAMGSTGVISRLIGDRFGSSFSFVTAGKASAPGQVPLADFLRWRQSYESLADRTGQVQKGGLSWTD